jgi:hypothetical protein
MKKIRCCIRLFRKNRAMLGARSCTLILWSEFQASRGSVFTGAWRESSRGGYGYSRWRIDSCMSAPDARLIEVSNMARPQASRKRSARRVVSRCPTRPHAVRPSPRRSTPC